MFKKLITTIIIAALCAAASFADVKITNEKFEDCGTCVKLTNGDVEVFVTKDFGPRIICYRYVGGENILGVSGGLSDMKDGVWNNPGGHRLWLAPEYDGSYAPDNDPLDVKISGSTATFTAKAKDSAGFVKQTSVTLASEGSEVIVNHKITNDNGIPAVVAPWALTVMQSDGTSVIPQEPYQTHDENIRPVRPMVLWGFTDLTHPGFAIGRNYVRITSNSAIPGPQKIGVTNTLGWAAYYKDSRLFVKRFAYDKNAVYADSGSNTEVYIDGGFMELESLGAMKTLMPGDSTTHSETWYLFKNVRLSGDDAAIAKKLGSYIKKTEK